MTKTHEKIVHTVLSGPHEYRVVYLGINLDDVNYRNSYIDIHFKKGIELKKLRFNQPFQLEIEKGFYGNICGMEILDIRSYQ